jgi:hypothetical protein
LLDGTNLPSNLLLLIVLEYSFPDANF